jgi:hypothetical protein
VLLGLAMLSGTLGRWPIDPLLWIVTLGGVYVTVPDTELAIVAFGACVPVLLWAAVAGPTRRADGGGPVAVLEGVLAAAALMAVLVIAASGGIPRPASLIGSLGCLGVLIVPGFAGAGRRHLRDARDAGPVLLLHVVVVLVASRIAGLQADVPFAVAVVGAGVVATAVGLWVLTRRPTG